MSEYIGENVIIMACSDCNLTCSHCYISYKGNWKPNELLIFAKLMMKKYVVKLNGSEILINKEYLKTLKELKQKYFMSNGYSIYNNNDIIPILKENNIYSVSISYHFGMHEKISPVNTEIIDKTIQLLLKNDLQVRLLTTISCINYHLVEEMCQKTYEMGARGIKFTNFLNQGNAKYINEDLTLNDDQLKTFFSSLGKARNKFDKDELIIERCGSFGVDINNAKNNFECIAGDELIVITPDLKVYPCVFLAKPGYEIGEVINNKIMINNYKKNKNVCIAKEICNHNNQEALILKR